MSSCALLGASELKEGDVRRKGTTKRYIVARDNWDGTGAGGCVGVGRVLGYLSPVGATGRPLSRGKDELALYKNDKFLSLTTLAVVRVSLVPRRSFLYHER